MKCENKNQRKAEVRSPSQPSTVNSRSRVFDSTAAYELDIINQTLGKKYNALGWKEIKRIIYLRGF